MTEQYTPTTEDIREYVETADRVTAHMFSHDTPDAAKAFDRWLAAHDAQVRAEALREAAEFIQPWNYDRPDDWTEEARVEATCADALRTEADRIANTNPHERSAHD